MHSVQRMQVVVDIDDDYDDEFFGLVM